jgi:hypothetical protein
MAVDAVKLLSRLLLHIKDKMTNQILNWGLFSTAKTNRALIKPLTASPRTRLLAITSKNQSSADVSVLPILSNHAVDFFYHQ